jgi:hypothetical protein
MRASAMWLAPPLPSRERVARASRGSGERDHCIPLIRRCFATTPSPIACRLLPTLRICLSKSPTGDFEGKKGRAPPSAPPSYRSSGV